MKTDFRLTVKTDVKFKCKVYNSAPSFFLKRIKRLVNSLFLSLEWLSLKIKSLEVDYFAENL